MRIRPLVAAVALLCLQAGGCAEEVAEPGTHSGTHSGTLTLLYGSPYSPNHPFSRADRVWMDWLAERSQGTLRIRPIWSGALLSAEQSLLELRHGVADVGLVTPIYVKGGAHLIRTQSGFYSGARTIEQQVGLYRCLARRFPQFGVELAGLEVLAVQGGSLPGIITRAKPVLRLEDLRGMRIRAPTELLGVLEVLGADPVEMAMGEVYSALAKGVIDGVVAPADTFASLHFAEVAGHYTRLDIPRGAYPARAMSSTRWRMLAPAVRELLDAATPVWEAAMAAEIEAAVAAGERAARASGVVFHQMPPDEQQQFDALYAADAAANAAGLARFGIAGEPVYRAARGIAEGIRVTGQVVCGETTHARAS